jgi:hypothetical protein
MEKGNAFLKLFGQLEEYLQRTIEPTKGRSVEDQLNAFAQKYPVHRQNVAKLHGYRKLRNALVHYRGPSGEFIAEPSEQALREFEQIIQAITSPPKIIPLFGKSDLRLFSPRDLLMNALQYMGKENYSQVIVQTEGELSLLTVEEIAKWLEKQAWKDTISLQEATIADAQSADAQEDKQAKNVGFLSQDQTIDDAKQKFMLALEQGKPRIYAVLITEHGEPTETPLGIITPWDLIPH